MVRLIRLATIPFSFRRWRAMLTRQLTRGGEYERDDGGICPSRISGRDRLARCPSWRSEGRRARLHDASDPRPEDHLHGEAWPRGFREGAHPGRAIPRFAGGSVGPEYEAAVHVAAARRVRRGDAPVRHRG